jgi:GTP-dependent phosphoenolpyruvate carboxykinase
VLGWAGLALGAVSPLAAHHSFAPHFDRNKPVSISGTITAYDGRNPHSYLHVSALDENGRFLWPGFGENMRVLRWIFDRVREGGRAKETPIGWVPRYKDIDWTGMDFPEEKFEALQAFDRAAWRAEVLGHEELFIDLHAALPKELVYERELLICRM